MILYFKNTRINLYHDDCIKTMKRLINQGVKVDSICTDPPYNIGFMGRAWDNSGIAFERKTWRLVYRLLKPGGHMLAFSATRNYHRMVTAIEDAGFEIRDQIGWLYVQGMPKNQNISKMIDKTLGKKPKVIGKAKYSQPAKSGHHGGMVGKNIKKVEGRFTPDVTEPVSDEAKYWEGWGTALKPSWEPIVLARRPLAEKTIAKNVLKYGTGGINIDISRSPIDSRFDDSHLGGNGSWSTKKAGKNVYNGGYKGDNIKSSDKGRWPSNIVHDGSDEVEAEFAKYGKTKDGVAGKRIRRNSIGINPGAYEHTWGGYGGKGSVSRFFYKAKAGKHDRLGSKHPTVKPIALMTYLINIINPIGGTVLDPFSGSGTTTAAALTIKKCKIIAIEKELEYIKDTRRRIKHHYTLVRKEKQTKPTKKLF